MEPASGEGMVKKAIVPALRRRVDRQMTDIAGNKEKRSTQTFYNWY
jgi:hypothetical protein